MPEFMAEDVAAVARTSPPELNHVRAATFVGRDADNLVTATVDGEGTVVRVKFATTIAMRPVSAVEDAIRSAIAAAHDRMNNAWREVARTVNGVTEAPDDEPGPTDGDEAYRWQVES